MKEKTRRPEEDGPAMLIEERRQHVLSRVRKDGRVLVSELSDALGISRITIRKDLDNLTRRGLVQRTHGGAIAPQSASLLDLPLGKKKHRQWREKERIAEAAAKLVHNGQCVLLDSGTTTTAIARALRRFQKLTVITNAVNIVSDLVTTKFDIILIGGMVRKNALSVVGPLAEEMLREIHADILFLGVDGFDSAIGISTPNVLESRVNRAMVASARRVVAVCDSTKFNRRTLSLIVPPTAVHTVITDSKIRNQDAEVLREAGIEVILA
jgi:DeoR family transcriptional regulator of aga operon